MSDKPQASESKPPPSVRPGGAWPSTHVEPAHPGPASHVEKSVRKSGELTDAEKRSLGEEASRIEDA